MMILYATSRFISPFSLSLVAARVKLNSIAEHQTGALMQFARLIHPPRQNYHSSVMFARSLAECGHTLFAAAGGPLYYASLLICSRASEMARPLNYLLASAKLAQRNDLSHVN